MPHLDPATARGFGTALLVAAGAPPPIAGAVARHLVEADETGHATHGLGLLPTYLADALGGRIALGETGIFVLDAGTMLTIDGRRGFGRVVAETGIERAAERARGHGIALLGVRHVHHLGRLGAFAELAAERGCASLIFANVVGRDPFVVPTGGRAPCLTSNPLAFGIPQPGAAPIVLDIATSAVALNYARVAFEQGKKLDDGLLVDASGAPTDDPSVLFRAPFGAILPVGAHKGYGLAVAIELLAGALTGGGTIASDDVHDGTVRNNLLAVLIDPGALAPAAEVAQAIRQVAAALHACPPVDPSVPVMLPGEPEARARLGATTLDYPDASWRLLADWAARLGVALPCDNEA